MKFNGKIAALAALSMSFMACENQDNDFPDYQDGISVYFPYQTPVRTLVLGTDEGDTSRDKAHKCLISATMGGAYSGRDILVDYVVDPTLVENVTKADGGAIKVMPENYYTLSDNVFRFNGNLTGAIEVELTNAFFSDPESVNETYVIPIVLRNQLGADRILSGKYDTELLQNAPARTDADSWIEVPQDYVLYCVNYKCKYDAYFSRTGKYSLNGGPAVQFPDPSSAKWNGGFDEFVDGEDCNTVTKSLNSVTYSVNRTLTTATDTVTIAANLLLTFDESDNCTVTSLTDGVTAAGSGKYTLNGAKKANNNKDRDLIELNYTLTNASGAKIACEERLIWKRSGVLPINEFAIKYTAE